MADTYNDYRPFLGIVLAGEYTPQSLLQLRSRGFHVMHFPTQSIVRALAVVGIDASSDDDTPEKEYSRKIAAWNRLSSHKIEIVTKEITRIEKDQVEAFCTELGRSLSRRLLRVIVIVLHGKPWEGTTIQEAVSYIANYPETKGSSEPALRYEVHVRYSNGDVIEANFKEKNDAIEFLHKFG